jgi:hypothetical protein
MASVVVNGDTSGAVTLSAPAVAGTVTVTLPSASGTMAVLPTATGVLAESAGGTGTTTGYYGFKNRIINGAMVINQRGTVNTPITFNDGVATGDRFFSACSQSSKATSTQSSTAPTGFSYSALITSSSAYSVLAGDFFNIFQNIEGFNTADLGWGTANAQTITLSFWVRSSLTGTFGGSISNNALDRSYPFTYTINSANTFEQKTVTIAGDTTGTWVGATNGLSMRVYFGLGVGSTYSGTAGAWAATRYQSATGATSVVGTNGATFYITGVQLEKGSTATSFDYRPYGTELQLCQRYYEKSYNIGTVAGTSTNTAKGSLSVGAAFNSFLRWTQTYKVPKRGDATFTIYSTTGASGNVRLNNASDLAVTIEDSGENASAIYVTRSWTLGDFVWWQWTASSEL